MNVSKILLNGVEHNITDKDAQSKISEINESLKDYAKSEDVAANYQPKGEYLTEHQSLDSYYTKSETLEQVNNYIKKVVGAAPEALDTLEEIADKLKDNDDIVAGIVNTLSDKADASALNNYFTKAEVESKVADAVTSGVESIDLTVYETIEGASDKYQPKGNYLTEHQSLADYVKKSAFTVNGETLEITFN